MKIKNTLIPSLIDEVIVKYLDGLRDNSQYQELDEKLHTKYLSRFGANLFSNDIRKVKGKFKGLIEYYINSDVSCDAIFDNLGRFFELYKEWVVRHNVADVDHIDMIKNMYEEQIQKFDLECKHNNEAPDTEDFFFLEDEGRDASIEEMHYDDTQKISASEFLEANPLDGESLTEIIDVRNRLEDLLDDYTEFSEEFLQEFVTALSKVLTTLDYVFATKEFSDISLALNKLVDTLNHITIDDPQMKELAYTTLVSFIEDLIKWLNELFIDQTAVDIHYLDASLYANIAQFEMIFSTNDAAQNGEDDFLF